MIVIPNCILAIEDDDDRDFMEALYRRYGRLMYDAAYGVLKHPADSEDVVQTILARLIDKKIPALREFSEAKVASYVVTACKHEAYNFIRDNKTPKYLSFWDLEDFPDTDEERSMELHFIRQEERDCLVRVWPSLDERYQYILEGFYILGKSAKELAIELGVEPSNARMILTRARHKVYELLTKELRTDESE